MKQRKHATIMFTDIIGHTTLMSNDEDKAFEVLKKSMEIHSKLIEQNITTGIKEVLRL